MKPLASYLYEFENEYFIGFDPLVGLNDALFYTGVDVTNIEGYNYVP